MRQTIRMNRDAEIIPAWSDLQPDPLEGALTALTERLGTLDAPADEAGVWPKELWSTLIEAKVPSWSLPGQHLERTLLLRRYARIAEGSLTAAFILSQHDAGVRRLAAASERPCAREWLDMIGRGEAFTTVGISQLTTSRRHGSQAMRAVETERGYQIDGVMPWVTAAERAHVLVTGAAFDDGRQILIALPSDREGVTVGASFPLAALQASCTAEVRCENVIVLESDLLAGPSSDVMAHTNAAGTGGLETSALALGQARSALVALATEAPKRTDLLEPIEALVEAWCGALDDMNAAALGLPDSPKPGKVRGQANGIVLRATQAYLTARKGSGFLRTEPAQRSARQALFFLVWSCPGPVADATIRDLAGICSV